MKYLLEPNAGDSHQTSPAWVAHIIPFANRNTFDSHKSVSLGQTALSVSTTEARANPVAANEGITFGDEIVSWSVSESKNSHTSQCVLTISSGGLDALAQVTSGDWVLFWTQENMSGYESLLERIKAKKRCNDFMDGLKFMGRISAIKRQRRITSDGTVSVDYLVTCKGFSEFDANIYFDETLTAKYNADEAIRFMQDIAKHIHFTIQDVASASGFNGGRLIDTFVKTLLGPGPNIGSDVLPGADQAARDRQAILKTLAPNRAYLVPEGVGALLGINRAGLTYADLLDINIGIQKYSGDQVVSRSNPVYNGFAPQLSSLAGDFLATIEDVNHKPIWSILESYLNHPVNEMYCTMRADKEGRIQPTFVARQVPFSSAAFLEGRTAVAVVPTLKTISAHEVAIAEVGGAIKGRDIFAQDDVGQQLGAYARLEKNRGTGFLSLPRWVVNPALVTSESLGQSDEARVNYVWVYGQSISQQGADVIGNHQQTFAKSPPAVDDADIKRSGLRSIVTQLRCNINEQQHLVADSPTRAYTKLLSDFYMGAHLRWSGTLTCTGIQEPVAVGDNLEWDGVVYHIEAISSQAMVMGSGNKHWQTTFSLSQGISVLSEAHGYNVYPTATGHTGGVTSEFLHSVAKVGHHHD